MRLKLTRGLSVWLAAALACPVFGTSEPGKGRLSKTAGGSLTNTLDTAAEKLTELIKPSVVVVSHYGREGGVDGVGTGFVISADGLIATCLHVIGEARPVAVQLADGRKFQATEIYAWDRKLDLAIVRVKADKLAPLALGDSDLLRQGSPVLAMGNPFGLEGSVVEGVVSARREVEGQNMIQLAMPIEPGNSGGPLVDRAGRVQGLLTLKSLVTANLGFAMPVNDLKKLLAKPNPVPIERWVTIGGLNPAEWAVSMGAHWSQRAGRIAVEGAGRGFGGRAQCLRKTETPGVPFEAQVWVKLGDESGAAGLAFGSDGAQRCYGFYPSDGRMRLTRFDGPSVYQWTILEEKRTPFYSPGAWNLLKARVEKDKIKCYVNGHLVAEAENPELPGSQIGLCKFRETKATFRGFKAGAELADESSAPTESLLKLVDKAVRDLPSKSELEIARDLQPQADASRALLMDRARQMESQAAQLRRVAVRTHREAVTKELETALGKKDDDQISLFDAAMLVSRLDNPDLDADAYREEMDRMSRELSALVPAGTADTGKLAAIKRYLFEENGFHGNRADYYDRSNSYMNDVLDDREGLPITLSILYLELARRIHLDRMVGLPLPGHFVVAYRPANGAERVLDVFDGGRELSREELLAMAGDAMKPGAPDKPFPAATKKEIIVRMLNNLYLSAQQNGEPLDGLHYLDAALAVSPDAAVERLNRARLRVQSGDIEGAKADYHWFMDHEPPGVDLEAITEIYQSL